LGGGAVVLERTGRKGTPERGGGEAGLENDQEENLKEKKRRNEKRDWIERESVQIRRRKHWGGGKKVGKRGSGGKRERNSCQ